MHAENYGSYLRHGMPDEDEPESGLVDLINFEWFEFLNRSQINI